jgi:hypothetical protein
MGLEPGALDFLLDAATRRNATIRKLKPVREDALV